MSYLMESAKETERLLAQQRDDPARERLRQAGLGEGQRALDAGCGPGFITEAMAELVGPGGSVVGLDANAERVEAARARTLGRPNLEFTVGDVRQTHLSTESFDFVWSQFVFEYLADPAAGLAELVRVTRPGGKVVVGDVDGVSLANWPFPAEVKEGMERIVEAVSRTGFDLFIGRKLYSLFRKAGLEEVRVRLYPHYVIAGPADARMLEDWRIRFETLAPIAQSAFPSAQTYRAVVDGFLTLLADPDALKYSVLLVTEGTRR
jgi:ubiquinone/menaquinone biosynthesis C-methylase UbiE